MKQQNKPPTKRQKTIRQLNAARRRLKTFKMIGRTNRKVKDVLKKNKVGHKKYLSDGHIQSRKTILLERNLIILRKLKRIRLTTKVFYDIIHPTKIDLDDWLSFRNELFRLLDKMIPLLYQGLYGIQVRWSLSGNKDLNRFARIAYLLNLQKYDLWSIFSPHLSRNNKGFVWKLPNEWFTRQPRSKLIKSAYDFYFRTEKQLTKIYAERIKYYRNHSNIHYCDLIEPYQGTVRDFNFTLNEMGIFFQTPAYAYDTYYANRKSLGRILKYDHVELFKNYQLKNREYIFFFNCLPQDQTLGLDHILMNRFVTQEQLQEERIDNLIDEIYIEDQGYQEEIDQMIDAFIIEKEKQEDNVLIPNDSDQNAPF